jgi:WD40 repeat protein
MKYLLFIISLFLLNSLNAQKLKFIPQNGHAASITKMYINKNGEWLATQAEDDKVIIYEISSGKIIFQEENHELSLFGISNEGQFLFKSNANQTFVLDVLNGTFKKDSLSQSYIPDKSFQAEFYEEALMINGQIFSTKFSDQYYSAIDQMDSMVIAGDDAGELTLFNGKSFYTRKIHNGKIKSVCVSPDKNFYVSTAEDKSIVIWSKSAQIIRIIEPKLISISALQTSKDEILIGDYNGNVYRLKNIFGVPEFSSLKISDVRINDIMKMEGENYIAVGDENKLFEIKANFKTFESERLIRKHRLYRWKGSLQDKMSFDHPLVTSAYSIRFSDEYYYVDYFNKEHGTLTARKINNLKFGFKRNYHYSITNDEQHNQIYQTYPDKKICLTEKKNRKEINYNLTKSLLNTGKNWQYNGIEKKTIFLNDKVYIADQKNFNIYNRENGVVLNTIQNLHNQSIIGIKQYNNYIISASSDGTLKIIDKEKGETVLSIMLFSDGFFISDTSGYYYTNIRNPDEFISFIYEGKLVSSLQLDLNYNRPEIILRDFSDSKDIIEVFTKVRNHKIKTQTILSQEEYLENAPISTLVNSDSIYFGSKINTIELEFLVQTKNTSIQQFYLYNNGVQIKINNTEILKKNETEITVKKQIYLLKGNNEIQFFAQNDKGIYGNMINRNIMYNTEPEKGTLYHIGIGVSEYRDSKYNLNYATKDINDLEKSIKTNFSQFKEIRFTNFLNMDANENMFDSINSIMKKIRSQDALMIHYAGHGVIDSKMNYYLAIYNTDFDAPEKNSISLSKVNEWLLDAGCYRKLLIMDACHSGEIDEQDILITQKITSEKVKFRSTETHLKSGVELSKRNYLHYVKELLQSDVALSGANILSAATGLEYSMESEDWKNGLFTYSLISVLKNNKKIDFNSDNIIQLEEWQVAAAEMVKKLSNGNQNPEPREMNRKVQFIIRK